MARQEAVATPAPTPAAERPFSVVDLLVYRDEAGTPIPLPPDSWAAIQPEVKALLLVLLQHSRKLEEKVAALEERLGTNSSNSSLPPSLDPPDAPRRRKRPTGRRRGAQPGHAPSTRELLPVEEVTGGVVEHFPEHCANCNHPLPPTPDREPLRHQVADVPPVQIIVTEHRRHAVRCPECSHLTWAEHPKGAPAGIVGPRLSAVVSLLTGRFRMSRRDVELFGRMVWGLDWSLGTVKRVENSVSEALAPAVNELGGYIRTCRVVNMDETPWKESNKRHYVWVANAPGVAVYTVAPGRDGLTAQSIVGKDFDGILGTDRLESYNFQEDRKWQHCLAHIDRDLEKFVGRGGPSKEIGLWGRREMANVFQVFHRFKKGELTRSEMKQEMMPIRARMGRVLRRGALLRESTNKLHAKTGRACAHLLKRFKCLWVFVQEDGVEPTNNASERAIRPAVRWRRVSFGTQSAGGSRFAERMLTVGETCRRQCRNALEFITECVVAALTRQAPPSLLPRPEG